MHVQNGYTQAALFVRFTTFFFRLVSYYLASRHRRRTLRVISLATDGASCRQYIAILYLPTEDWRAELVQVVERRRYLRTVTKRRADLTSRDFGLWLGSWSSLSPRAPQTTLNLYEFSALWTAQLSQNASEHTSLRKQFQNFLESENPAAERRSTLTGLDGIGSDGTGNLVGLHCLFYRVSTHSNDGTRYWYRNSVSPSVRLLLSGIVSKRLNMSSYFLYHIVATSSWFSQY